MDIDTSHMQAQIADSFREVAFLMTRPSVLYRPELAQDGNAWIALYGPDLAVGVVGCGSTPEEAMADFDNAWTRPAVVAEAREPDTRGEAPPITDRR